MLHNLKQSVEALSKHGILCVSKGLHPTNSPNNPTIHRIVSKLKQEEASYDQRHGKKRSINSEPASGAAETGAGTELRDVSLRAAALGLGAAVISAGCGVQQHVTRYKTDS